MNTENTYQTPQDTTKKTLPFVVPTGRVEEFYDFSEGASEVQEPEIGKADTVKEKPVQKKTSKPEVKKDTQAVLEQKPETGTIDFSAYKFLKDTIRPKFEFKYVNFEAATDKKPTVVGPVEKIIETPAFDYAPSVFVAHELQVQNPSPLNLPVKGGDGVVIAFMAILGVFSMVKVAYYKKAKQYFSAFFNLRMNSQILREEKSVNEQLYSVMLLGSVLVSSTFLFQLFKFYGIGLPFLDQLVEGFLFLKIFSLTLMAIILKLLAIKILGFVFNAGRQSSAYVFNQILFFNILNLALFPICVIAQYSGHFPPVYVFVAGGIVAMLVFGLMFQRFFVMGISEVGTSTYYLFLYLCTLEILPVVILAKLLLVAIV